MPAHLTWVIFDSITNSVFSSQVLMPLARKLARGDATSATIISFEHNLTQAKAVLPSLHLPTNTNLILYQRLPFFGIPSLWQPTRQLLRHLLMHQTDILIARGPLAGRVVLATRSHISNRPLTIIQARGLAAAEQRFTCHQLNCSGPIHWFHHLTNPILEQIEVETYSTAHQVTIEAVSPALATYLINTFHANASKITIATDDIPTPIPLETYAAMRRQTRQFLGLDETTHIYCYSGSAHPWQCLPETISYFSSQLVTNPNAHLLILTTNPAPFLPLTAKLPPQSFTTLSVPPALTQNYLCAADTGILFRKPHIINHVSRPTKALEYAAAYLHVHHNNTVDYLIHGMACTTSAPTRKNKTEQEMLSSAF